MMRRSLLAAAALVVIAPIAAQAGSFDGFYLGAQVGAAFTGLKETQTSPLFSGGSEVTDSLAANGVVGGVVGGYGKTFDSFYVGGEIDATFGNRDFSDKVTDPTNPSEYKLKTGTEWGVSFRPGYLVNDHALVYGLLGLEQAPLKISSTASGTIYNKTQTVFRLGLGTEVAISGPLSFRADYTHTFLNNITTSDQFGDQASFDPSEDKVKLGVVYHF